MSHPDKQVSLGATLALLIALATACTRPPAPPPAETPPQQPETPAIIKATVHTNPPTPAQPPTAFAFTDPSHGWAATGTTLLTTTNAGQSWTQVATFDAPITQLDFPSPDMGWALTQTGQLHSSKDGGGTWQYENRIARNVDFVSPTQGFTLEGGALFMTKDGGQTWRQTAPSPCGDAGERWSNFLSFISPQDGWIACGSQPGAGMQGKAIYRTRDGGATWELTADAPILGQNSPTGRIALGGYLRSLFFLDDRRGWIGLSRGVLLATTDGGVTWEGVDGPMGKAERFISGITFLSPDRGYVLDQGIIYTTADGGRTFSPVLPALAPADVLPKQMLDARRWVTAGTRLDGGAILWTEDAGRTWRKVGSIENETVDALHFTPDAKQGWALGTHWAPDASYIQTVYRTDDGGATWAPLFQRTGVTFGAIREISPQILIATTNTGEVHVSRDGGQTFTSLTGAEPEPPSHTLSFISLTNGWRLREFALEVTTDGGKTWAPSNLKTRVVQYDLLPDGSAWVVGGEIRNGSHQSELFFTPDWGATWTRFDLGPLPGAGAIRCADRDHCLVIAGEAGQYMTADGGRSWDPIR